MIGDTLTIVIWCVGVVSMAATAWIQDRREVRREKGEAQVLRDGFEERISHLENEVKDLRRNVRLRKGDVNDR